MADLAAAPPRRATPQERLGPAALLAVFATGVYGGYFGAAQGILLLSILGLALHDTLQRINATKNVLAGLVNLLAGVIFAAVAHVSWPAVGLIAAGSVIGGTLGGRYGRRLPGRAARDHRRGGDRRDRAPALGPSPE